MRSGIVPGLKTKSNGLRFSVLDLDHLPESSDMGRLAQFEQRIANTSNKNDDTEFRRNDSIT